MVYTQVRLIRAEAACESNKSQYGEAVNETTQYCNGYYVTAVVFAGGECKITKARTVTNAYLSQDN